MAKSVAGHQEIRAQSAARDRISIAKAARDLRLFFHSSIRYSNFMFRVECLIGCVHLCIVRPPEQKQRML